MSWHRGCPLQAAAVTSLPPRQLALRLQLGTQITRWRRVGAWGGAAIHLQRGTAVVLVLAAAPGRK